MANIVIDIYIKYGDSYRCEKYLEVTWMAWLGSGFEDLKSDINIKISVMN